MDIVERYKENWRAWDIRFFILSSLLIQIILMFFGRWRKKSSSRWMQWLIWITYVLANWVADFALGFLSRVMLSSSASVIFTFWAAFLFLHCGGPDTITAYNMEDNELWSRQFLGLVYGFLITLFIIYCSLPNTSLLAPTILVFLVAIIKNVERSYSLYYGSSTVLQRSIASFQGVKQKLEMQNYLDKVSKSSGVRTNEGIEFLNEKEIFELYLASKPHFVGGRPWFMLPDDTLIRKGNEKEVLRVIDMELSYAYDELYTKASVNHSKVGYLLRSLCSICILLGFLLFILASKDNFNKHDMAITYVLLVASISIDIMAFIMLFFSNWMLISLRNVKKFTKCTKFLFNCIVRFKKKNPKEMHWSGKMPQLNIIRNYFKHHVSKKAPLQRLINWIEGKLRLVTKLKAPFAVFNPRKIVFEIYPLRSLHASQELQEMIIKHVLSCIDGESGFVINKVLRPSALDNSLGFPASYYKLMKVLSHDEQVFVWHIATELFFHWYSEKTNQIKIKEETSSKNLEMEACNALSNYMMHMVLMRPEIMSIVVNIPPSFWLAHEDMLYFPRRLSRIGLNYVYRFMRKSPELGDTPTLFQIARVLCRMIHIKFEEEKKWEGLILVWVNLLLKSVKRIKRSMFVKQLSGGGDLFIFIWLLTKHAGIEVESTDEYFEGNRLIGGIFRDLLFDINTHSQANFDEEKSMSILEKYKEQWRDWDIRFLILLSLFIQTMLMFLGRWRKISSSKWIQMLVWSTYVLANSVANFALGFLTRSLVSSSANGILAFWATFLFLHCGGPDTIIAYSMEDNVLWRRQLLGLGYEFIITFYVIFCSLPNTILLTPIILIFLVAIIKNVERIYSLYYANSSVFHSSFDPFVTRPTTLERKDLGVNEIFELYSTIKLLFIDESPLISYTFDSFPLYWNGKEVLRVIDIELSYAYDELYTKAFVNHNTVGYILRALCSTCILLAFLIYFLAPKDDFNKLDVAVTYVLLVASICLDIMAFIMLLFSNWMLVSLLNAKKLANCTKFLAKHIAGVKKFRHKMYWSGEMPQLNLINNCFKHSISIKAPQQRMINWIEEKLGLIEVTKLYPPNSFFKNCTLRTLQSVHAPQELQQFIVKYVLKLISFDYKIAGQSALEENISLDTVLISYIDLMTRLSFDEQVFVWHIATELCFHWNSVESNQTKIKEETSSKSLEMEACNVLSNYMMHMVMMRPEIMSTMGRLSTLMLWGAYEDMVKFIKFQPPYSTIDQVYTGMRSTPKEYSDSSLFQIARVLYRMMLCIEEENKWQVMVSVWVHLMLQGVKKIKPSMLLKQLSRGGDLIMFIWLLTKHARLDVASLNQSSLSISGIENANDLLSKIELHLQTIVEAGAVGNAGGEECSQGADCVTPHLGRRRKSKFEYL